VSCTRSPRCGSVSPRPPEQIVAARKRVGMLPVGQLGERRIQSLLGALVRLSFIVTVLFRTRFRCPQARSTFVANADVLRCCRTWALAIATGDDRGRFQPSSCITAPLSPTRAAASVSHLLTVMTDPSCSSLPKCDVTPSATLETNRATQCFFAYRSPAGFIRLDKIVHDGNLPVGPDRERVVGHFGTSFRVDSAP